MVICILDSFSVIFIDRLWLGVEQLFVDPVIGGKTEKNKRQKFEIILSRYTKEYTVYFCPNIKNFKSKLLSLYRFEKEVPLNRAYKSRGS